MKLATTTDTREDLDAAAQGRIPASSRPTFVYTEVGPSLVLPDGTIEHGEPRIVTDVRDRRLDQSEFQDAVGRLTPAQEAAAVATYQSQLAAARSAVPDLDETLAGTTEEIPNTVLRFIVTRTVNGPLIGRYLSTHPTECEALRRLPTRAAQRRVEEISAALATDPGFGMDADNYRTFRAKREEQIKRCYR